MDVSFLNGQPGHLPLNHRSAAYGDGVFETLWFDGQTIHFLDAHFDRLKLGAETLNLNWSERQHQTLRSTLLDFVQQAMGSHVLKVMLLRDSPGRGYGYGQAEQRVDVIIQIKDYQRPDWARAGARVKTAETMVSRNPMLAGIKHCNRLDSVMARSEYPVETVNEVLMLDEHSNLIEGSMSNVFILLNNRWITPSLEYSGVHGIMRQLLLAELDGAVEEFPSNLLTVATSILICNSLIGAVPVISIDGREFEQPERIDELNTKLGFK